MDKPRSSSQSDRPTVEAVPSAQQVEQWRQALDQADVAWVTRLYKLLADIQDTLTAPDQESTAREAAVFVLQEKLRVTCESRGYELPKPTTSRDDSTLNDDPHTDSLRREVGEQGLAGRVPAIEKDKAQQLVDLDAAKAGAEREEGAETQRTVTSDSALTTQHLLGQTFTLDVAVDRWNQALAGLGIVQGTADNGLPVYVGGQVLGLGTEPVAIPVTMDLSTNFGREQIQEVQSKLWQAFTDLSWSGQLEGKSCIKKLHPWAVVSWVNFFTGHVLNTPALKTINRVIRHATQRNDFGYSAQGAETAMALSSSDDMSPREKQFYTDLALTLADEIKVNNAYARYQKRLHAADIGLQFEAMVEEASANTVDPVCEDTGREQAQPSNPADCIRERVGQGCADSMGWELQHLWDFLSRHEALSILAKEFSAGILLLITPELQDLMNNNAPCALPSLAEAVKEAFPEFQLVCQEIHTLIGDKLIDTDPAVRAPVFGKTISIDSDESTFMARIRSAFDA